MPRSVRIATFALVVNALLGLALLVDDDVWGKGMAGLIIGFVALDAVALVSLAVLASRRKLAPWTVLGLTAWFVGLLASAYFATWIVDFVTSDDMPSWTPGDIWFHVETFGRAIGQMSIVLAFVKLVPQRAMATATVIWCVLTAVAIGFTIKMVGSTNLDTFMVCRWGREITFSGSLLALAWIVVTGDREIRARELAPARVVR